jgi:hypothetical protein
MKHIATIVQLVDFFGGDTALSGLLDISQSAVAHWKKRQQIPAGWHLRLLAEISHRGATVDPKVFGLFTTDAAGVTFPAPLCHVLCEARSEPSAHA